LENLLFDDFFNKAIHKAQPSWRDVVAEGARLGIPTPAFSTALSWFDGYRSERLPAALLQAQRDYFGAHTFKVLPQFKSDKLPEGQDIHVNWVPPVIIQLLTFRLEEVEMFLRRLIRLKYCPAIK
jgi:6-phosphogluconate dehydrogenase